MRCTNESDMTAVTGVKRAEDASCRVRSQFEPASTGRLRQRGRGELGRIVIRTARGEDCGGIARIYNEAIAAGRSTMDTETVDESRYRSFLDHARRETLLFGEVDHAIVGWSIVKRYSDRPGYRFACETSIYIAAAHQNDGYGSALFAATMEQARAHRYRHVVAKIVALNDASIRFLERFGFEIVGRQREIGFLNGVWQDVVIMQRVFDDVGPAGMDEAIQR